jgi:hypothetical protein
MVVHLVPVGKDRFELYAEPVEEPIGPPSTEAKFIQRWVRRASVQWHALVDEARRDQRRGRFANWRDRVVRHLAENMAEQRTLWGLLGCPSAMLLYPSTTSERAAREMLRVLLTEGRRHHGRWLVIEVVLLLASAILAIVPGPNLVAYYFLFRAVGHLQSWRGARHGLATIAWTFEASDSLSELVALVDVPREARATRVEAIAARLKVPRLSAFFDRAAVPSS